MIINRTRKVNTRDVSSYSWNRLSQFHNTEFTADVIAALHGLDKKQKSNAKKQAEQIRYCLIQAQEYFNAAHTVTLATKPVLLYYGAMSLALAEVLLKQTGDSRLHRLRSDHNCHGLTLGLTAEPEPSDTFAVAASKLIAKAQRKDANLAKGTFEVWRRSAREYPIGGMSETKFVDGSGVTGFEMLMTPEDKPPPMLPESGISLFDCVVNLPYMEDILGRWGTRLQMVRANISKETHADNPISLLKLIVHPTQAELLEKFGGLVQGRPDFVNCVQIKEVPGGYVLLIDLTRTPSFSLPHATGIYVDEVFFTCLLIAVEN